MRTLKVQNGKQKAINLFLADSSLQASQQGTKTQGVTKEEEKRRTEAKESDNRQQTSYPDAV